LVEIWRKFFGSLGSRESHQLGCNNFLRGRHGRHAKPGRCNRAAKEWTEIFVDRLENTENFQRLGERGGGRYEGEIFEPPPRIDARVARLPTNLHANLLVKQ
jgi:hypothetical protein